LRDGDSLKVEIPNPLFLELHPILPLAFLGVFKRENLRSPLYVVVVTVDECQNIHLFTLGPAKIVLELLRERDAFIRCVIRVVHPGIVKNKLETICQLEFSSTAVVISIGNQIPPRSSSLGKRLYVLVYDRADGDQFVPGPTWGYTVPGLARQITTRSGGPWVFPQRIRVAEGQCGCVILVL